MSERIAQLAGGGKPVNDPIPVIHEGDGAVGADVHAADDPEGDTGRNIEGEFPDQAEGRGRLVAAAEAKKYQCYRGHVDRMRRET